MKLTVGLTIVMIASAGTAIAQSRIDELCGAEHVNEVAATGDVRANPGGYYVGSLTVQLSHDDPRIVEAVGDDFYLCTRSAATPAMSANRAIQIMDEREVKFLFVPIFPGRSAPGL